MWGGLARAGFNSQQCVYEPPLQPLPSMCLNHFFLQGFMFIGGKPLENTSSLHDYLSLCYYQNRINGFLINICFAQIYFSTLNKTKCITALQSMINAKFSRQRF